MHPREQARCSVPLCAVCVSSEHSQPACLPKPYPQLHRATSRSAFTPHRRLVETIPAQRHACLSCSAAEEPAAGSGGGYPHHSTPCLCDVCVCALGVSVLRLLRLLLLVLLLVLLLAADAALLEVPSSVPQYNGTCIHPSQASSSPCLCTCGCVCVCLCLGSREHGGRGCVPG